jgi:hypothetical protein
MMVQFGFSNNEFGQFGNGTSNSSNIPVQVPGLSGITSVAAGMLMPCVEK